MQVLKNIGPDERSIPAAGVTIRKGAQAPIGTGAGQVPEAIAREYANDEPQRWKIVDNSEKKKGSIADSSNPKSKI